VGCLIVVGDDVRQHINPPVCILSLEVLAEALAKGPAEPISATDPGVTVRLTNLKRNAAIRTERSEALLEFLAIVHAQNLYFRLLTMK
jgi:hypothetical protein